MKVKRSTRTYPLDTGIAKVFHVVILYVSISVNSVIVPIIPVSNRFRNLHKREHN
jgi:hypothetical protein